MQDSLPPGGPLRGPTLAPAVREPLVRLERIDVAIGEALLLADLSLSIEAGAPTVIVGPNGAGKTTLLKLIAGLLTPTRGRIVAALARAGGPRTALVFQRPVMLRRSTAANVAYALRAAGKPAVAQDIQQLLARVMLGHCRERPARHLSGGEQQRLALARALAREPDLLLLDEPTASLDPASTKAVEDIVRGVAASGVKVVMSTHDLGQARRLAGHVVLLAGGRLVEHTAAPEFFQKPTTATARRFLDGELVL